MAKQILVPLKRDDQVEAIIPNIERIAQPGMRVVFLLRYPLDGFQAHIRAGRATGETGIPKPAVVRTIVESYSLESQQRLARQRVFPACDALQKKGAEVAVDVYTGNLGDAVKSYTAKGDVHLILQRAGIGHLISRFINDMISVLRSEERPSSSPTLSIVATCWPE